jgi:hypothetical protein
MRIETAVLKIPPGQVAQVDQPGAGTFVFVLPDDDPVVPDLGCRRF